jgi:hypothetical protein
VTATTPADFTVSLLESATDAKSRRCRSHPRPECATIDDRGKAQQPWASVSAPSRDWWPAGVLLRGAVDPDACDGPTVMPM